MKLQAREIIRAANKHGIKLERGCFSTCVVGVICTEHNIDPWSLRSRIAKELCLNPITIMAIEAGFEGYNENYGMSLINEDGDFVEDNTQAIMKSRYYKVGRRVAELAGLNK